MRPDLHRLQQIEHYLRGPLTPQQAADWHTQRLLDADLDADATAQQAIYCALHVAGRQQLRQELRAIHAQLYSPPTGAWAVLSRLVRRWTGM